LSAILPPEKRKQCSIDEIGHFYFGYIGHYHFGITSNSQHEYVDMKKVFYYLVS